MKITIYTIPDCPFCKQEKEYLTSKTLTFEEKNVQDNKDALAEMLQISNNFAGVPFTLIEKDEGEKVMLKGFTQSEFDEALGGMTATQSAPAAAPAPAAASAPASAQTPSQAPTTPAPLGAAQSTSSTGGMAADMTSSASSAAGSLGVTPDVAPTTPSMTPPSPSVPSMTPPSPSVPPASTTASVSSTPAQEPQDALNDLLAGIQTPGAEASAGATAPAAPSMTPPSPSALGDAMSTTPPAAPIQPSAPTMPPAPVVPPTGAPSMAPASTAPAGDLKPELPNLPDFGKAN